MADDRFVFDGLAELQADLRALPANLTSEASGIVLHHADQAAQWITDRYRAHWHTGNLAKGVQSGARAGGRLQVGAVVRSTAPHAHLYEYGTQARHYITKDGKQKNVGAMPPANCFIPIVLQKRRAMYQDLANMLREHELEVSGAIETMSE